MDNTEKLATLGTQDDDKQTIQRHWQHWVHKTTTNKQSRDTGNIGYKRRRQTNKQTQHNTIFVGHHYTETNTNK